MPEVHENVPVKIDKTESSVKEQSFFESHLPPDSGGKINEVAEQWDNLRFRLNIWKTAFKFGLESPLLGKGYGIYPVYLNWDNTPIERRQGIYVNSGIIPTHNHLIAIFYKMGLLGLCLFLFINISVFIYSLSYLKTCKHMLSKVFLIGGLGGIIFWNTMALFFDVIDSPPTSIFLWILIGMLLASVEADKKVARRIIPDV